MDGNLALAERVDLVAVITVETDDVIAHLGQASRGDKADIACSHHRDLHSASAPAVSIDEAKRLILAISSVVARLPTCGGFTVGICAAASISESIHAAA